MTDPWGELLDCLDLRPLGHGAYEGRSQHLGHHRLFGGQLLAQSVRAAALAAPGKAVKSLHALFLREGRGGEPVRYETELLRDGRTYAAVHLTARQEHGLLATATVSLHTWEGGARRQSVAAVGTLPGPERRADLGMLPWESRAETDLDTTGAEPATHEMWTRIPHTAPVHGDLAPALLAYATDLTLIGTALRPVAGVTQQDTGRAFTSAVTSHTVWFHQPSRTDAWFLLRQHSPVAAHGRCFGRGDVLTGTGELVASYAQEGLLRMEKGESA